MAGLKILSWIALLTALLAGPQDVSAQPKEGSQLPESENRCASCHDEGGQWKGDQVRLHVPLDQLAHDVHRRNGVNCHDCHGGNPLIFKDVDLAHAEEIDDPESAFVPFRRALGDVWDLCVYCHEEQQSMLQAGVHSQPSTVSAEDEPKRPDDCRDCHGQTAHGMYPVDDSRSPVRALNQVDNCGSCHEQARDEYLASVHGHGLQHSGLAVSAMCVDCHGAHEIHPATDPRSPLHHANVASTCAMCHLFIEERLQKSVHGLQYGAGRDTQEPAPGGVVKRTPSCTDCHVGHDLTYPKSGDFQLAQADRCGNCHVLPSDRYAISVHGQLTELGYVPAATCSDCHGSHDIRAMADSESRLSSQHRKETCEQCHLNTVPNFLAFDPHADPSDPQRDPILHGLYIVLVVLLIGTFAVFGVHSLAWFARSLIHIGKHGRGPKLEPGTTAYMRFKPSHRAAHTVMMISFLGLSLTGLPLKYSHREWAQTISTAMGGFASTGLWHRIFGVLNVGCLVFFVVWISLRLIARLRRGIGIKDAVFGGDSPIPNLRDAKDFIAALRWFFGLGPKPTFDHWAYWEKFDLWGASADIVIIGATGLMLWFPNLFCMFLPGESLNYAMLIHTRQALLATSFVFAIHFFSTHLRPEKFPMDMSVLTGLVTEHELEEERPDYLERLRRENKLEALKATVPSRGYCRFLFVLGVIALMIGWALLIVMVGGLLTA